MTKEDMKPYELDMVMFELACENGRANTLYKIVNNCIDECNEFKTRNADEVIPSRKEVAGLYLSVHNLDVYVKQLSDTLDRIEDAKNKVKILKED